MDLRKALHDLQKKGAPESAAPRPSARAPLIEIFWSVQGEGRFVGLPMTFLRTATCPLRCLYCDTPNSYTAPERFPVRFGVREQQEANPATAERAAELAVKVATTCGAGSRTRHLSITGGEPLVFPEFVREVGRLVRQKGMRCHLETAAIDSKALALCIDQVDHLSADYKLPETLGAPVGGPAPIGGGYGALHRQCCEVALQRGATVDVKIVLTDKVADASLERAFEDLGPLREKIVVVLQPVTPFGAVTRTVPRADLERFLASTQRAGFDARVLPQVHKTLQLP